MRAYLQGIKTLDLRGVDEGVFNVLGSLPDDSSRMDALRRLSGAQWTVVPSGQAVQERLKQLLERGTKELLQGHAGPSKPKQRGSGGGPRRR